MHTAFHYDMQSFEPFLHFTKGQDRHRITVHYSHHTIPITQSEKHEASMDEQILLHSADTVCSTLHYSHCIIEAQIV